MNHSKITKLFGLLILMGLAISACAPAAEAPAAEAPAAEEPAAEEPAAEEEKTIIGLSFSDFATERWKNEEILMRK